VRLGGTEIAPQAQPIVGRVARPWAAQEIVMNFRQTFLAALALAALPAGPALASIPPSFATKAAEGGMAEVEMAQLANDHASNADVKDFAQRMITDHTKANDELKELATKKGWTLPASTDAATKAKEKKLSALNGAAFDRAYMSAMVTGHEKVAAMFQQYAKTGKDAELRAFAQNTLPTIEAHEKLAHTTDSHVAPAKMHTMKMKSTKARTTSTP
jgi:putative membrane protein